jgi:hypothetical protein
MDLGDDCEIGVSAAARQDEGDVTATGAEHERIFRKFGVRYSSVPQERVMALFGPSPEEREAALQVVRPMIDWVQTMPVAELAAELMAAFGPQGPSQDTKTISESDLLKWLFRGHINFSDSTNIPMNTYLGREAEKQVGSTLREATQLLEHAELVCVAWWGESWPRAQWSATRLGLAALSAGKDAVRQRIRDRTGL